MVLPVAIYYEPWNKAPQKKPLKPSEKLATAFPYLCFILVVMGMSSGIFHETHAVPVVTDISDDFSSVYGLGLWRYVEPGNNEIRLTPYSWVAPAEPPFKKTVEG